MDEPEDDDRRSPTAIEEEADEGPLTTGDFHTIAQKQIMNAVFAVLAEAKMEWALVAPFLEAARELCLADFEETGRVRLHVMRAEGESWVEAEEAFLGISVSDRDERRGMAVGDLLALRHRARRRATPRRRAGSSARSSGASPGSTPGLRLEGTAPPSDCPPLSPSCRRR